MTPGTRSYLTLTLRCEVPASGTLSTVGGGSADVGRAPKLLIFVPAYRAQAHIEAVLSRIARDLRPEFDPHVLVIDDASDDATATIAAQVLESSGLDYEWEVLANPRNLGYGGNQKLGYRYAIRNGMDVVVMVHGDGQYPPEHIAPLARAALGSGAAFGSRFGASNEALAGGMPRYKYVGNKILTQLQNRLLSTELTEFHSGFRAYSVDTLRQIPFHLCSNDFHFDTEIFIQCIRLGVDIAEFQIPTRYGDEVCHVNGMSYARNVIDQSLRSKLQEFGLVYERKFDVRPATDRYESKIGFDSPSESAIERIRSGDRVVDVGASAGHLAAHLADRGCAVVCIDRDTPAAQVEHPGIELVKGDLDDGIPEIVGDVDVVVMLDVIEHLRSPERFASQLADFCTQHEVREICVSTGNVAFLPQRLMLMLGQFNYGPRGILDMTHTRLFTESSFRRLWEQAGFVVDRIEGIPAPFPLALGDVRSARALLWVNRRLIRLRRQMFSYQIFATLRPPVDLNRLIEASEARADRLVASRRRVHAAPGDRS